MTPTEVALAALLRKDDVPEKRDHIRLLIESTEDGLDKRILAILHERPRREIPQHVLCRILAERQPDRDPSYALNYFRGHKDGGPIDRWIRNGAYRSPLGMSYGISRLRQARPIEHYARDVTSWLGLRRFVAVHALGDTADPAAVWHLLPRLSDWQWRIRGTAVIALRRLVRQAALSPDTVNTVADALVARLYDGRRTVVAEAAAALADPPLRQRLAAVRQNARLKPHSVALVDEALAGNGRELHPVWPGE